jgi:hypothetical protein
MEGIPAAEAAGVYLVFNSLAAKDSRDPDG